MTGVCPVVLSRGGVATAPTPQLATQVRRGAGAGDRATAVSRDGADPSSGPVVVYGTATPAALPPPPVDEPHHESEDHDAGGNDGQDHPIAERHRATGASRRGRGSIHPPQVGGWVRVSSVADSTDRRYGSARIGAARGVRRPGGHSSSGRSLGTRRRESLQGSLPGRSAGAWQRRWWSGRAPAGVTPTEPTISKVVPLCRKAPVSRS